MSKLADNIIKEIKDTEVWNPCHKASFSEHFG